MKRIRVICFCAFLFFLSLQIVSGEVFKIPKETLRDKIKGGWAGKTIGCTFGGPTEFRFQGTFIQDYQPIPWYDGYLKWCYENNPGLYDDVYMDLTFIDVLEKEGLQAPAAAFAKAFAEAKYPLWHANQMARYNVLRGIMPPQSGHWLNNPHADDIDFQIESDFAGLMSPGMVNTVAEVCNRAGHIMNYGDGWYGGVYVAAMYSLAFVSNDIEYVVAEALKTIPEQSQFAQVMKDVIRWHQENPADWKETWFKVQKKWSEDVGCPEGVFSSFNIDAKINAAWILLGLLYGNGDFGKTLSISARAGDDSDCNPASAGGILGTLLGYKNIPDDWKQGLAEVEPLNFKYTTISLQDAYELSYKHALNVVQRKGGKVDNQEVQIEIQKPVPVKLERSFEGHYPLEKRALNIELRDEWSFNFEGIGFAVSGEATRKGDKDHTFKVGMSIDQQRAEVTELPTAYLIRKNTLFWKYQLPMGEHKVRFKVLNPSDSARVYLGDVVIYGNKPSKPKH